LEPLDKQHSFDPEIVSILQEIFLAPGFSMIKKFLLFLFLFPAVCCYSQSITPDVIGSAGDFYSNASGMIQWTIGETMTETYGNGNNFITQGFQQPDDFTTHVLVQNTLNVALFPNPASEYFTLEFPDQGEYTVEVFNSFGQNIIAQEFSAVSGSSQFQVPLADFANGIYFVNIKKSGTEFISGFKLHKIS
jgi:hypothetical protein